MVHVEPFGTTAGGREVEQVTLSSTVLTVRLLTLGAAIATVVAPDVHGRPGDVHLGLPDLAAYEDRARNPHLGATIGRYANRIAGARFTLDGHDYFLVANNGPNTLHGGPDGWDRQVWDLLDTASDDGSAGDADGGTAVFRLASPDGDEGFPGRVTATATFEVAGDRLRISYHATTDAPTVINMTDHGYWNLDGAPTVADHHLAVAASRVLPVDAAGIPTGTPEPVGGTPFDLRSRSRLGPVIDAVPPGLDHCYAIDGAPGALRPAAVLDAPASGRWMTVRTDQPGLQVYTGNGLGAPFAPHGSVSLETQRFPDAPNRPELGACRLDPGDDYVGVTELRFGTGEPPAL